MLGNSKGYFLKKFLVDKIKCVSLQTQNEKKSYLKRMNKPM